MSHLDDPLAKPNLPPMPRRESDDRRWWSGFIELVEQRIEAVFAKRHRIERFSRGTVGKDDLLPIYDPQLGSGGAGFPCSRCRLINQSDARVCSSCGLILKMTP